MRVLQVTDWNPLAGGVESYVRDIRPALTAAGIAVRVLTSSAGTAMEGTADFVAWGTSSRLVQAGLQVVNPFAWNRMRRAIRTFQPDVVHVHSFAYHLSPAVVLAARNVPVVITIHDYKPICPLGTKLLPDGQGCEVRSGLVCWRSRCVSLPHWVRDQPRYALIRRALARAKSLLVASDWMRQALGREGIDCENVSYPVPPPTPGYARRPGKRPLFMYCGRLAPEKGVALLLRAFARLGSEEPRSRLRLVGDGPERRRLEQLAAGLGVLETVSFSGWQPPKEVERSMGEAWALVVPSLWAEPFGIVAVEAITRGLPVVASRAGGLAETIVDGVSGLHFSAGNEEALCRCLRAIARGDAFPTAEVDPATVETVRAAHSPKRHVERLQAIYRRVASPPFQLK